MKTNLAPKLERQLFSQLHPQSHPQPDCFHFHFGFGFRFRFHLAPSWRTGDSFKTADSFF